MANDTKSVHEIEQDIERDRSRLAETLDALSHKLSIDGIIGDVSESVRRNGSDLSRSAATAVKDNPLAVALTTAGIAWLFSGPMVREKASELRADYGRSSARQDRFPPARSATSARVGQTGYASSDYATRPYGTDPYRTASASHDPDDGKGIGARISETVSSAKDAVVSAAHAAGDAFSSASHNVSDSASHAAMSAQERARILRDQLSFDTEHLSEAARERVIAARQKAVEFRAYAGRRASSGYAQGRDLVQRHPFVAGAALLAIGGAIAASLPRTRFEDEEFGRYRDDLIADAERVAREETERARAAGRDMAREARDIVDETKTEARAAVNEKVAEFKKETPDAGNLAKDARERAEAKADEAAERMKRAAE